MERHEPPGAEVDQEIGLVRVFFLQKEEVHNAKVTGSLKRLTRGAPAEAREVVQLLRTAWSDLLRAARYSVGIASAPPEFSAMRTDRAIAEDYVYGNYLHNDPDRRARIKHLREGEARMAALL